MTTTATRTDVHRPSAEEFDPSLYTYEAYGDFGGVAEDDVPDLRAANEAETRLLAAGYRWAEHVGGEMNNRCGHCGARVRYFAILSRSDTRELIVVGEQCDANRFDAGLSKAAFQELRKAAALNRERRRLEVRVAEFVEAHPGAAWLTYVSNIDAPGTVYGVDEWSGEVYYDWRRSTNVERVTRTGKQFSILRDLAHKLSRYATLSDKQVAYADRLLDQITERYEEYLEREAAKADVPDAPEGRVAFEGEVVKADFYENDFGGSWKMTVATDEGWRVFVSVPSSLDIPERGDRVALTATLERSKDDRTMAWGKRPAKARLVSKAAA